MKKSVFLKWIAYLFVVSLCVGIWNSSLSSSQQNPAVSKTPPAAAKQQPQKNDEPKPQMFLETAEHDMGVVYEGTLLTHSFTVKNKGKGDLLINQVKPG